MSELPDRSGKIQGPEHVDDPELMLRIARGEPTALGELMSRYWARLVRYAVRLVPSIDAAEDMVQQAFVTLWRERRSYRSRGTPQAYLYRIVRNEALQELRRQEVRRRKADDVALRKPRVSTPLEVAALRELDDAVQRALAGLSARRREAFVLARYHDLSLTQVAEIMGVSPQTAANHVSLAMAELRRELAGFLH